MNSGSKMVSFWELFWSKMVDFEGLGQEWSFGTLSHPSKWDLRSHLGALFGSIFDQILEHFWCGSKVRFHVSFWRSLGFIFEHILGSFLMCLFETFFSSKSSRFGPKTGHFLNTFCDIFGKVWNLRITVNRNGFSMFLGFRATFLGDVFDAVFDLDSVHTWDHFLCDFGLHFESFLYSKNVHKKRCEKEQKSSSFWTPFWELFELQNHLKNDRKKRTKKERQNELR